MRTPLLIALVLIGVLIVGVTVFLATFDVDRYRPLLVTQLESALGKPVHLERLSLGWRGGIAVELQGLAVYPDASKQGEPAAAIERVIAVVRLLPLLRREVRVASVVVQRPTIRVRREPSGAVNVVGLAVVGAPAAASGKSANIGGSPVALDISALCIEDGTIHVTDAMANPPLAIQLRNVDVVLKNTPPMGGVFYVDIRVAAFSKTQNLTLKGRLRLPARDHPGELEDVKAETDLGRLDLQELAQAFPAAKALGPQAGLVPPPAPSPKGGSATADRPTGPAAGGGMAGRVIVTVDRAVLDPKVLTRLAARVQVSQGRVVTTQLGSPIEEVTVDIVAAKDRIDLKQASARIAGGGLTVVGTIESLDTTPASSFKVRLERWALDSLFARVGPDEPQLRGRLDADFEGRAQGLAWPQISRTLTGQGRVNVQEARIERLNILREVFQRLSILPGLMQSLQAKLPASYQAKLTARDTVLEPIDLAVTARDGALAFARLQLATDSFQLEGAGRLGLDGVLSCPSLLHVDPELSAAIIRSVAELAPLADAQGRLELPVVIQGTLPRVVVLPDVQYVASRVVATKAQELLGGLLERALERRDGSPANAPPSSESPAPPSSTRQLLEQLIGKPSSR